MRISLLGLLLIGCGGGGGTSFEGIYRVDTWTDNLTGCAAEGPSVAQMKDAFFYTKNEEFFGETFLNVKDCPDVATCKADANEANTVHFGAFGFEQGNDDAGWTNRSAIAFPDQGQCKGGVTDSKMTISATAFRIEATHFKAVPFPAGTGEDECPDDKVEQAAAGQPCDGFEVVTATFMEDY